MYQKDHIGPSDFSTAGSGDHSKEFALQISMLVISPG